MELGQHTLHLASRGHTQPEHVAGAVEAFAASGERSLTLVFMGGLGSAFDERQLAQGLLPEFRENARTYPLFVTAATGLLDALQEQLLQVIPGLIASRRLHGLLAHAARALAWGTATRLDASAARLLAELDAGRLPIEGLGALDVLDDLLGLSRAPDGRARRAALSDLLAALPREDARIVRRVLARYRDGRAHGLAATVLEELYRSLPAGRSARASWRRIQHDAQAAFHDPAGETGAESAGRLLVSRLRALRAQRGPFDLHLVAHSAGAVGLCRFLECALGAAGSGLAVRSITLLAPACTCELAEQTLIPYAHSIGAVRLFALADARERSDPLLKLLPLAYPRSLLYFASGLLEAKPATPLLGLERDLRRSETAAWAWLARGARALVISPTAAEARAGAQAGFTSHSGPWHDPATLHSIATLLRPPPATELRSLDVAVTEKIARVLEMPPLPRPRRGGTGAPFGFDPMEAVIGEDEMVDHALLKGLLLAGRSVARLVVQGVEGFAAVPLEARAEVWRESADGGMLIQGPGTGWIFGRARRLLMTNNHVLPLPEAAESAVVEFGYERDLHAQAQPQVVLRLDPAAFFLTSPNMAFDGLDYTLVALSRQAPEELAYLEPEPGRTAEDAANVYVVQHPRGNPKTYVLNHNRKVNVTDRYVTYISDTLTGSSGAPLFDDALSLIGIHHVGNYKVLLDGQPEPTNLGSRMEVVVQDIVTRLRAAGGWTEERLREWFGDGPVMDAWRS